MGLVETSSGTPQLPLKTLSFTSYRPQSQKYKAFPQKGPSTMNIYLFMNGSLLISTLNLIITDKQTVKQKDRQTDRHNWGHFNRSQH